MASTDDDSLELRLVAELRDAVSCTGGLRYQEISELRTLLELPQVRRQLDDFSTEAEQLSAVRDSVRHAIESLKEPRQVLRRGRLWSPELISPKRIRDALLTLLNEMHDHRKSDAKIRREAVINDLALGISVGSMRRRGVGPEFELMRPLARSLIASPSKPVKFERIAVEYVFDDDYASPLGVCLARAYVFCTVRTLQECQTFEETGFYLIPWRGVLAPSRPFHQHLYSLLAHYSNYAPADIIVDIEEEVMDEDRNPILTVPFRGLWRLGDSSYSYSIRYPQDERSMCARPGDENYELIATPAGDMKGTVSIEVTTPRPVEISVVGHADRLIFNALQAEFDRYHSIYQFHRLHAGDPFGLVVHWNDEAGKRDREFMELLSDPNRDLGELLEEP